jgi:hypothetical protein
MARYVAIRSSPTNEMESSTLGDRPTSALGDQPPAGALGDRGLVARASLALLVANVRYWTSVAPIVRSQLRRWEQRASEIGDPELRALALEKLRGEGFHAEAAAMLATLAPRRYRSDVVEAIVALELLFDYLDGLTERPSGDPLGEGAVLFGAYTDALAVGPGRNGNPPDFDNNEAGQRDDLRRADGGYLQELSGNRRSRTGERGPQCAGADADARGFAVWH